MWHGVANKVHPCEFVELFKLLNGLNTLYYLNGVIK